MVYIQNNEEYVQITIEDMDTKFHCFHKCTDAIYAKLLAERLSKTLHDTIEFVRLSEYNQGWKAAKAKTRKRSYAYRTLSKRIPE